MIGLQLLLSITCAACTFNFFAVLAAALWPFALLHLLPSSDFIGQVVKAGKVICGNRSLISSMTA
jgi:hypothetical protein